MKTYLVADEVVMLENEATNLRDKVLIRMLFRVGCRVSEILALKVEDIDFSQRTITIWHLKSRLKISCPACKASLARRHTFCPQCGGRVDRVLSEAKEHRRKRTLPIDKETLSQLTEYIDRGGPVLKNEKRLLFGINRHRAWQIVKEYAEKAGLPKLVNPETGKVHNVSPHRLRDAFAVMAVKQNDSGDGIRLLQEHLGHQSITTTMRYRKVSGEEHRDWYQKLWHKDEP